MLILIVLRRVLRIISYQLLGRQMLINYSLLSRINYVAQRLKTAILSQEYTLRTSKWRVRRPAGRNFRPSDKLRYCSLRFNCYKLQGGLHKFDQILPLKNE